MKGSRTAAAPGGEARQQERGHRRTDGGQRSHKKRNWGTLKGVWVPHDTRDEIVDYIGYWTDRAELPAKQLLGWLELGTSKFHTRKDRYGKANEHNGKIPRDFWLEDWERQAILDYHDSHPLDGYRRLTFMMLDDDIVAVSPSSVYRVLRNAGRLYRNRWAPSKKGTRFVQPDGPHTTPSPTESWNAGTDHSNRCASDQPVLQPLKTHEDEVRNTWTSIITGDCTVRSATSHQPINSMGLRRRSSMNAIASWKKLANAELCQDRPLHAELSPDHNDLDPDGG
jgi:hypothetical protein